MTLIDHLCVYERLVDKKISHQNVFTHACLEKHLLFYSERVYLQKQSIIKKIKVLS